MYTTAERVREVVVRDQNQVAGTGATLPDDVIEANIQEADQEIDGKLSSRYRTPFDPVPALIETLSRDIAAMLCDLTFREVRDYQSELNPILMRHKRAQEMLKALASGAMDLPPSVPSSSDDSADGLIVAAIGTEPIFNTQDFDIHPYRPTNRRTTNPPASECWGQW